MVQGNWVGWSGATAAEIHLAIQQHINPSPLLLTDIVLLSETDGDGVLEPGEAGELELTLQNTTHHAYSIVSAQLTVDSPWVTIETATAEYPAFAPLEQHGNLTPFLLTINADAPPLFDTGLVLELLVDGEEHSVSAVLSVGQLIEYYRMDVEEGTDTWTHGGIEDWGDQWHISTEDSQSPVHSWKCGATAVGDYANHLDSRLVTETIQLLPYSRLSFRHRIDSELSGAFPDSAYDGAIVELSADGVNWEQLTSALSGGYNRFFRWESGGGSPASHPFQGGMACWSGSFDWLETVFDLTAYGEAAVQFRLRFGSDNGGGDEGWYIDDFILTGYEQPQPGEPLFISISYTNPWVTINWETEPQATGYRVYRCDTPYGDFEMVQEGTTNSYITDGIGEFFYYVTWF